MVNEKNEDQGRHDLGSRGQVVKLGCAGRVVDLGRVSAEVGLAIFFSKSEKKH